MANEGKKLNVTPAQRAARSKSGREIGFKNLAAWKNKNPYQSRLKHGANSKTKLAHYDDRSTPEGAALGEALNSLIDFYGGPEFVTAPMWILISTNVEPRLKVIMAINKYISEKGEIVSKKGELPPCLGTNYLAFSNGLRRDLEVLTALAKDSGSQVKVLKIEDIIAGSKPNDNKD